MRLCYDDACTTRKEIVKEITRNDERTNLRFTCGAAAVAAACLDHPKSRKGDG